MKSAGYTFLVIAQGINSRFSLIRFYFVRSMYYTYIIFSKSTGKYYTGHTNDFVNRFKMHNDGLVQSTKRARPWTQILLVELGSKSEAFKLEMKIKKRGAKRYLLSHLKNR